MGENSKDPDPAGEESSVPQAPKLEWDPLFNNKSVPQPITVFDPNKEFDLRPAAGKDD